MYGSGDQTAASQASRNDGTLRGEGSHLAQEGE